MSRRRSKENVSLVGFMYSGKSSVGREAALRTGLDLVDFDAVIEERLGMSIPEIFSRYGEEGFRDHETRLLRKVCRRRGQLLVPGGGILLAPGNAELLRRSAATIWLRIGIEEVMRRIARYGGAEGRPLLGSGREREDIGALLARREERYRECDVVIDVDGRELAEVVDLVVDAVRRLGFG